MEKSFHVRESSGSLISKHARHEDAVEAAVTQVEQKRKIFCVYELIAAFEPSVMPVKTVEITEPLPPPVKRAGTPSYAREREDD